MRDCELRVSVLHELNVDLKGTRAAQSTRDVLERSSWMVLDTHQMKERTFTHRSARERYRYREAARRECVIELMDSQEPTYIYERRAVRLYWENGRESWLVSSIANSLCDASEGVKAYGDRWPSCEKHYAMMKAAMCVSQIVGYGKKHEDDHKMLARIQHLETHLEHVHHARNIPRVHIAAKEQQFLK